MADFYLENCTHEEAVNALKKCKEKVTFVVDKAEQHYPSSPTIGILSSWNIGLNRTGHMSFPTGQDPTPKFSGQVLLDRTESRLVFLNIFKKLKKK